MIIKEQRKLNVLFDVREVSKGNYGEGFYDALKHVRKLLKMKLSKEQFEGIEEVISIKVIQEDKE